MNTPISSTPKQTSPIEVFIAYAHEDDTLRKELVERWLKPLKREGLITDWHDQEILPGEDWQKEVDEHLKTAQVILLLISQDFIASDYCYKVEVKQAMEREKAKTARVIPIILRHADFDEWDWLRIPKQQQPPFFSKYPQVFDPKNLTYPNPYGHTRATSYTMLAYDATLALLNGGQKVLMDGKQNLSPANLQQALPHTTFQGVSGRISLGSPNDKPFVVLCVNSDRQLQIESVQGCLQTDCPLQPSAKQRSVCT